MLMVAFAKHYDAAGNMIVAPKTGDEDVPIHYVYDAWNRQVGVYADEDGELGALIAEYKYDGANRRVSKTLADDTSSEYFYNQGWQLLEERSLNDEQAVVAVNQYVWSASYIDAPVVRFHDGDADGECDPGTDVDDTIRHYTWDANHNVTTTITVDYTETVTTEHYVYSAYGKATVYDEDWTTNLGDPAEDGPLYCGYWFDLETGNDLARNRYYSVYVGSFISRDPIAAEPNLYRYVGGNPLRDTDPSGLVWALYDIPESSWKCAIVDFALSWGGGFFWNKTLMDYWREGGGKPYELNSVGFGAVFDTDGSERSRVMQQVYYNAIIASRNLKCGESKSGTWEQPRPKKSSSFSGINMVSNYEFWAECTYTVTKECDEKGCCTGINVSASCDYHAWDRVDFWPGEPNLATGENMFGLAGIYIADRLVRACHPEGRGFDLTSNASGTKSWTIPCTPPPCIGTRTPSVDSDQDPNNRDYFIDQNGNVISWDRGTCGG